MMHSDQNNDRSWLSYIMLHHSYLYIFSLFIHVYVFCVIYMSFVICWRRAAFWKQWVAHLNVLASNSASSQWNLKCCFCGFYSTPKQVYAKYNQQDAAYYNILYCYQSSPCFRRFPRPSPGAQKLYIQHLVFVKISCCYF